MSYEGSVECLCANGHYSSMDAYCDDLGKCRRCDSPIVWRHDVDQTNGECYDDDGEPIQCTHPWPLKKVGEEVEMREVRIPVFEIPSPGNPSCEKS